MRHSNWADWEWARHAVAQYALHLDRSQQYESNTLSLALIEDFAPSSLKDKLGALDEVLSHPLGEIFDTAWAKNRASQEDSAKEYIVKAAKKGEGVPLYGGGAVGQPQSSQFVSIGYTSHDARYFADVV